MELKGSIFFVSNSLSCYTKFSIEAKSLDKDSSLLSSREILDSFATFLTWFLSIDIYKLCFSLIRK